MPGKRQGDGDELEQGEGHSGIDQQGQVGQDAGQAVVQGHEEHDDGQADHAGNGALAGVSPGPGSGRPPCCRRP